MFLFDDVMTACRGDHLLVVEVTQARDCSNRSAVTRELVGMDELWDIVFTQASGQERLRSLGITVTLKEDVERETVLIHSPPKPVSNAIDARTDLVPMAQFFGEERSAFDAPFA